MKYLIVVESPSKCKKVQGYLSKSFPEHEFIVLASVGHFTHLAKRAMGIKNKITFDPIFEYSKDKSKVIAGLKAAAKKVDKIIIATDLDAEGEKIGYDLSLLFKLDINEKNRMIFNEITQNALKASFNNLTKINMDLVHAQFARRVLDRLIGFEISKITAKEIQRGVSAGRVLSITTKIINEKEKELSSRTDETHFQISGCFEQDGYEINNAIYKEEMKTKEDCEKLFEKLKTASYKIDECNLLEKRSCPPPPFITSTINQSSPYGIRATTSILQKLYQRGFITYIRTDSTKMSEAAKGMIKKKIVDDYGDMFQYRKFNTKKVKGAQEAHECIRPTKMDRKPSDIKDAQQRKIYNLIYNRSMACLMKDARYNSKDIKIKASTANNTFNKTINEITFLGWKKIYMDINEANKDVDGFANIKQNDNLDYNLIECLQKYNSTTGRFTESKLVNTLEKMGIGRPSTYATAVSNIQTKQYVTKGNIEGKNVKSLYMKMEDGNITSTHNNEIINAEKNKLLITKLGTKVTEFLDKDFDTIMNYDFTADVESDLDKIQDGSSIWYDVVKKYYEMFHPAVAEYNIKAKKEGKKSTGQRLIGEYKGKNFYTFSSQYGPRVIYGEKGSKDILYLTPIGKSLLADITLKDAIALLPRTVCKFEGKDVVLHYSKNLYIKWNGKNVPLHWSCRNKTKQSINDIDVITSIEEFRNKKNKKKKKSKKTKPKTKTVAELKKEAKEKGIKGYTKMKKADLLKVLAE